MRASTSAPSAWRGLSLAIPDLAPARKGGPLRRLARRAGREVVEHPVETMAVVAMTLAIARLAMREERSMELGVNRSRRRKQLFTPISLMAAICLLMLSG